jgi:hypothetical protein
MFFFLSQNSNQWLSFCFQVTIGFEIEPALHVLRWETGSAIQGLSSVHYSRLVWNHSAGNLPLSIVFIIFIALLRHGEVGTNP